MSDAQKRPRSPVMSVIVIVACVLLAVVGVCVTIACLVSMHLEVIGFGEPPDAEPRADYIAWLIAGAAAGILIPAATSFFLLRSGQRIIVIIAALAILLTTIVLLGMGW